LAEWETFYYENVKPRDHLIELGRKLYVKITEVLVAEIDEITEQDCIDYVLNLVINRTYDGYVTEVKTVYGQLAEMLSEKIEPATDEWDRLYNVDFYIKVGTNFIGLQIKPASDVSHISQIFKERQLQAATHQAFTEQFGGHVYYVVSRKEGEKKVIHNIDVVDEIRSEIQRLRAQRTK